MSTTRPLSLSAACVRLLAALAVAGAVAGGAAWIAGGWPSVVAMAVAIGLCGAGGVAALAVSGRYRGPHRAMVVIFAGALLRGVGPLAAGLALRASAPWLAEAGIEKWVLGFYLFTLFVEAWLLPGLLATTFGSGERDAAGPSSL